MALKLWSGPSGSGKTRFLFEYVLSEASKNKDKNYLVIVPEQFTLSTQKELIRLSKDHGILNVDVLSFARLAYRIFEEVGFKNAKGKAIDDMGKNLIIRHLAVKNDDKLKILSGNMDKLGYITEVKSAISEFMQYGITPDRLKEMSQGAKEAGRGQLSDKLKDIETLYRLFNEYTEEKYITKEEILSKASKAAWKSEKLKKSVVVFDGYTGFTPVQYDLIEVLLQIACDIHVTILTDTRDNITYNTEHELFYLGYKTSEKLKRIAELNNVAIDNEFKIVENIPRRYLINNNDDKTFNVTNDRLVHLEKNLFREYGKAYKSQVDITDDCENSTKVVNGGMRVFSGLQPIDEVTKIAVEIQKLIRNKGVNLDKSEISSDEFGGMSGIRYKDIAIATGDLETYIPIIRRVFKEYDIPFFIDKKQPVLLNPFIEYVRAMVGLITENFTYSAVFRMLRSPLSGYESYDIDRLENFVLKFGIKGVGTWKADWVEKYSRYSKEGVKRTTETVDDELIFVNEIRKKFILEVEELTNLITGTHSKNKKIPTKAVNEINAVFMRCFEHLDIENRINSLIEEYSITDDTFEKNHRKEYEKVYAAVTDLMERMNELLDGEEISYSEYGELLDAGFDEIRVGIIPTITDYIQIGDLTRSRFGDIHTLFIVGANDGIIPKGSGGGGIISDIEREYLVEKTDGIELAPTIREQAYTGRLYLYMLMTKPTHQLVVSYSRLGSDSESLRPSYIIKVITDMFPDLVVEKDFDSQFDKVVNVNTGLEVLSQNIRNAEFEELLGILASYGNVYGNNHDINDCGIDNCTHSSNAVSKEANIADILRKLVDASFTAGVLTGSDNISKAVAEVLYGKAIIGSVTRLEQFARCSFRYFLQYGLSLKEREIFSFEAKDMGNIFHSVLEKYSSYVSRNKLSWTDISDSERDKLVQNVVLECIDSPEYAILMSSSRHKYMIERITRISKRSVDILTDHLRAGKFEPKDAEISFSSANKIDSFTFKLSDDEILRLTGKIDRLDTYEDVPNGRVYIKVIDYKSGNKSFDLVEVYKGLNLQLVVYMNAAMELTKMIPANKESEVIPAGLLYYHIDDPMIEGELSESDEVIGDKILKELRMKGLVNDDKEVIKLIDGDFEKNSDIIPVSYTTNMELTKSSSAVNTDDFKVLSEYVNQKISEMGRDILSGNIKAEPHTAKGVDVDGCTYCQYADICKYDGLGIGADGDDDQVTKDNAISCMRNAINGENEISPNGASNEEIAASSADRREDM